MAANGQTVQNENHSNGAANGSVPVKNTSDMAIYEQYRNQVLCFFILIDDTYHFTGT